MPVKEQTFNLIIPDDEGDIGCAKIAMSHSGLDVSIDDR
jgi:hypothetical protein